MKQKYYLDLKTDILLDRKHGIHRRNCDYFPRHSSIVDIGSYENATEAHSGVKEKMEKEGLTVTTLSIYQNIAMCRHCCADYYKKK